MRDASVARHPARMCLSSAGASNADMIIAVTNSDEVNMLACQVGHSLFNIPKKIARIRNQSYLDPAWANLFSRSHMPIDVIISPEVEVANSIVQRSSFPGPQTLPFSPMAVST
jgi:trk system potassium uptake protein TrkA